MLLAQMPKVLQAPQVKQEILESESRKEHKTRHVRQQENEKRRVDRDQVLGTPS